MRYFLFFRLFLPAALALLLSGCLPIHKQVVSGPFLGLSRALPASAGPTNTLHILIVHGMGIHPVGYSDPIAGALAKELGLSISGRTNIAVGGPFPAGWLRETLYTRGARQLHVWEITWSPATEWIKWGTFAYDIAQSHDRQLVNGWLKKNLLDLNLADAVLYAGRYRPEIQRPVQFGLDRLLDALQPGDRVAMLTMSLGSYILFDTIEGARMEAGRSEEKRALQLDQLAAQTSQIFMLANQIPLLRLSDLEPSRGGSRTEAAQETESAGPPSPLAGFIQQHDRAAKMLAIPAELRPLQVVAFTDPNDLLSYKLQDADVGSHPCANVTLTVAPWSILGIAANPFKAHTGWTNDSRALRLLLNGSNGKSAD